MTKKRKKYFPANFVRIFLMKGICNNELKDLILDCNSLRVFQTLAFMCFHNTADNENPIFGNWFMSIVCVYTCITRRYYAPINRKKRPWTVTKYNLFSEVSDMDVLSCNRTYRFMVKFVNRINKQTKQKKKRTERRSISLVHVQHKIHKP